MTRDDLKARVQQISQFQREQQERLEKAQQEAREAQSNLLVLSGALHDCGYWQQKLDAAEADEKARVEADKAKAEQERVGRRRKRVANSEGDQTGTEASVSETEEPPAIAGRIGPETVEPVTA